jgi:hypothetical protein
MVVDTSIKITKATREKLYFLKGPDRDYNAVIEDLIEEHYSRPCSCQNSTGNDQIHTCDCKGVIN